MWTVASWGSSFPGGQSISFARLGSGPAGACPGQRSHRNLLLEGQDVADQRSTSDKLILKLICVSFASGKYISQPQNNFIFT